MPNNSIRIFDVETRSFPIWQREFSQSVSQRIAILNDPMVGITFVPASGITSLTLASGHQLQHQHQHQHQSVVAWGSNWICRFHLNPANHPQVRKRTRGDRDSSESEDENQKRTKVNGRDDQEHTQEETEGDDTDTRDLKTEKSNNEKFYLGLIKKYRNILGIHFMNSQEMVVIERPLIDALSGLPPAYFQGRYGT
jgi:U3 small nucleolar RNA-associated protein 4